MLRITDANSYEELESYLITGGYNISYVTGKINWFKKRDATRYNDIICWLQKYRGKYKTAPIDQDILEGYMAKYGATKAVVMLKEELGIVTTRQNLYKRVGCNNG